ncbi:MAG: ABC transporter permease [Phycisphaerales bacterium]
MRRPSPNTATDQGVVLAMRAPAPERSNPFIRNIAALSGLVVLAVMMIACLGSLPWTLGAVTASADSDLQVARYNAGSPKEGRLPPVWAGYDDRDWAKLRNAVGPERMQELAESIAIQSSLTVEQVLDAGDDAPYIRDTLREAIAEETRGYAMGTDALGRSLWVRVLAGGGISLTIGLAAAFISVFIGTLYGALSGYAGGVVDSVLMRIVDVLYGLPYILLVVLLAVASDAVVTEYITRSKARAEWTQRQVEQLAETGASPAASDELRSLAREAIEADWSTAGLDATIPNVVVTHWFRERADEPVIEQVRDLAGRAVPPRQIAPWARTALDVMTLLFAIAAVSWLTVARVVRGQVLSLKEQPFVEAARAMGAPARWVFAKHLIPNLIGPIVVYATLAVPQAILQESFLSFLGIGVKPPLPSWGNLAADGLGELNTFRSHWWLLFFPCLLLGITLLALNFVGEGLREAFDPKRKAGRV